MEAKKVIPIFAFPRVRRVIEVLRFLSPSTKRLFRRFRLCDRSFAASMQQILRVSVLPGPCEAGSHCNPVAKLRCAVLLR